MASIRSRTLILCAPCLLAAGFAAFSVAAGRPAAPTAGVGAPKDVVVRDERRRPAPAPARLRRAAAARAPSSVRVELDLVRAAALDGAGGERLGEERDARLIGQLVAADGGPMPGIVRFVAGPNEGRVVPSDRGGRFAAAGLVPGCSIVEVSRDGACVARRVVRLPAGRAANLHVTWAGSHTFGGRVVDRRGDPVADAKVHVDGRVARTDGDGRYAFDGVPAGELSVDVVASGHATERRQLCVPRAGGGAALTVTMRAEAVLELVPAPDEPAPPRVWVLPASAAVAARTPWERYAALTLADAPLRLRGLPAGAVRVYVHRAGRAFGGGVARVELREHAPRRLALPAGRGGAATRGRVERHRAAVADAVVECWSARPRHASARLVGLQPDDYDRAALPLLPPAFERVRTDARGGFVLSSGRAAEPWRQLRVTVAGRPLVDRPVWHGDGELVVDVAAPSIARGGVDLGAASHARHVEVVVGGAPRERRVVPPGAPLVVTDLLCGAWQVRLSSRGVDLLPATRRHVAPGRAERAENRVARRAGRRM